MTLLSVRPFGLFAVMAVMTIVTMTATIDASGNHAGPLARLGFLEPGRAATRRDVSAAISRFQRFMGITDTGKMDNATKELIRLIDGKSRDLSSLRIAWDHQAISWTVRGRVTEQERNAFRDAFAIWNTTGVFMFIEVNRIGSADIVVEFSDRLEHWDLAGGRVFDKNRFILEFNGARRDDWIPNVGGTVYLRKYAAYLIGVLLGLEGTDDDPKSVMSRRVFDDYEPPLPREIRAIRNLYPNFARLDRDEVRRPFEDPIIDDRPTATRSPNDDDGDRDSGGNDENDSGDDDDDDDYWDDDGDEVDDRETMTTAATTTTTTTTPRRGPTRTDVYSPTAPVIPVIIFQDMFLFQGAYFWRQSVSPVKKLHRMGAGFTSVLFDFNGSPDLRALRYVYQNEEDESIGMIVGNDYYRFDRERLRDGYPKRLPDPLGSGDGDQIASIVYDYRVLYVTTKERKIVLVSEDTLDIIETKVLS